MYYPYRRYSPFNFMSRGNYRYTNYPQQNNYGYVNNQPQASYGYADNPAQANFGYVNYPPQNINGYVNNQPQAGFGYVNNQPQPNLNYVNNPAQANINYVNNQPQANYGYANNMVNAQNGGRPAGNAAPPVQLTDNGPGPFVVNIDEAAKQNNTFRTALWTGEHIQLTLMSINPGEDIGFEVHPDVDQFIRIEEGGGILVMGEQKDNLDFQKNVSAGDALIIPAGKWHNLVNSGRNALKLYSIYAPPQHPFGTVHLTKADTKASEKDNG